MFNFNRKCSVITLLTFFDGEKRKFCVKNMPYFENSDDFEQFLDFKNYNSKLRSMFFKKSCSINYSMHLKNQFRLSLIRRNRCLKRQLVNGLTLPSSTKPTYMYVPVCTYIRGTKLNLCNFVEKINHSRAQSTGIVGQILL
jgi:hypothetical protein